MDREGRGNEEDIRENFKEFVDPDLMALSWAEESLCSAFSVMAMHPVYKEAFETTHNYLMTSNGALGFPERHYIAMMASCRHQCQDLVQRQKADFLTACQRVSGIVGVSGVSGVSGGDQLDDWALGLGKASARMQGLDEINRLLAHQPWRITSKNIKDLTQKDITSCQRGWSLPELVQAIVLMAHFHSLSSFVLGCGRMQSQKEREEEEKAKEMEQEKEREKEQEKKKEEEKEKEQEKKKEEEKEKDRTDAAVAAEAAEAAEDATPRRGHVVLSRSDSIEVATEAKETMIPEEDEEEEESHEARRVKTDMSGKDYREERGKVEERARVSIIMRKMESLSSRQEELETAELKRRFNLIETQEEEAGQREEAEQLRQRRSKEATPTEVGATPSSEDKVKVEEKKREEEDEDKPSSGPFVYTRDLHEMHYVDFARRADPATFPTARTSEINWTDVAYVAMVRFYGEEVSLAVDDKLAVIKDLTYMSIGKYTEVDTTLFRRAVQNYIHCLFGIRHDDYDYGTINELLPRPLKKYIKTVCCYPERCLLEDYKGIMPDFLDSEKVHVCLLVCEARFMASLLYAFRAVNAFHAGH